MEKNLLFDYFEIIELDIAVAKRAGVLRREYGRPFADMIVAATAITHDLSFKKPWQNIGVFSIEVEPR